MSALAKAIALFGASSFVGTLTQVARGKLAAVILGPAGVGVLGQLTNLWTMVHALSGLSMFNGVVQRIAAGRRNKDDELVRSQFASSLYFLTGFSCVTAVIGASLSGLVSDAIFGDAGLRAGLVALIILSVPLGVTSQTYRSLLTGHSLVKPVVKAQVASDLAGLAVFVPLVIYSGLWGAVLSFCLLQLLKLIFQLRAVAVSVGRSFLVPDVSAFDWKEVRANAGFGVNGIVMAMMSIGCTLIVFRMIITQEGLENAGIYGAATKVATLYFGAIYAAAGGYLLPVLVSAGEGEALESRVNETSQLYLFMLPPAVVGILSLAPELMTVLFTSEFEASARLLALILPADLLRVTAETMGLTFLATRRLVRYTGIYLVWVTLFLVASHWQLSVSGLSGVAGAYAVSHLVNFLVVALMCWHAFRLKLRRATWIALLVGVASCVTMGILVWTRAELSIRLFAGSIVIVTWLAVAFRFPAFRSLFGKVMARVRAV